METIDTEVTPEMIRAGAEALCAVAGAHFDIKDDWNWLEYNIPKLYRAMQVAREAGV